MSGVFKVFLRGFLSVTGFYRVLSSFTELSGIYRVFLSVTGFYPVLLGPAELDWVFVGVTGFLPGFPRRTN